MVPDNITSQDCVANAVRNPSIGLTCLLEILVCLLNMLQPAAPGLLANMSQCKLILVNLSDMSEFIACVRNPGWVLDIFRWFLCQSWLTHPNDPKRCKIRGIKWIKRILLRNGAFSPALALPRNRFVFETCVSRCKVRFTGGRVQLEMTGSNWARVNEPNSDITSLAYSVKDGANDMNQTSQTYPWTSSVI